MVFLKKENTEAFEELQYILNNAEKGFFLFTTKSAEQQHMVLCSARELVSSCAVLDFSEKESNTAPLNIVFTSFLSRNKGVEYFFVINLQAYHFQGRKTKETVQDLNMLRDVLHHSENVWIFGMNLDFVSNMQKHGLDFYSFFKIRVDFLPEDDGNSLAEKMPALQEDVVLNRRRVQEYKRLLSEKTSDSKQRAELLMAGLDAWVDSAYGKEFKIDGWLEELNQTCEAHEKKKGKKYDWRLLADCYKCMSRIYIELHDQEAAIEKARRMVYLYERNLGILHPDTAIAYSKIAVVLGQRSEYREAQYYCEKALHIFKKAFGEEHPNISSLYNNMGIIFMEEGNYSQALLYYEKSLALSKMLLGEKHPSVAHTYNNMAKVYVATGQYNEALIYFEKTRAIEKTTYGTEHISTAFAYRNIAIVLEHIGEYDNALQQYKKAYKIMQETLGGEHPKTRDTCERMDELKNRMYP